MTVLIVLILLDNSKPMVSFQEFGDEASCITARDEVADFYEEAIHDWTGPTLEMKVECVSYWSIHS